MTACDGRCLAKVNEGGQVIQAGREGDATEARETVAEKSKNADKSKRKLV